MQRTKQIISIEPGSSAIWLPDKELEIQNYSEAKVDPYSESNITDTI
jgi:hypothetical protein